MRSGAWTIVIQAADLDFTVQRQFSLTVGASNTVVVTVSYPILPLHTGAADLLLGYPNSHRGSDEYR